MTMHNFSLGYQTWAAHDKTNKMSVRPVKTQISLSISPVWSESSLSTWRKLGSLAIHWVRSKDSDQTGQMPRLIWDFAGRSHFVGFDMRRLTFLHNFWLIKNRHKTLNLFSGLNINSLCTIYKYFCTKIQCSKCDPPKTVSFSALGLNKYLPSIYQHILDLIQTLKVKSGQNTNHKTEFNIPRIKAPLFYFTEIQLSLMLMRYRKNAKNSDTRKIRRSHPRIWTRWLCRRVMHPNDADRLANSVDPDQEQSDLRLHCLPKSYLSENFGSLRYILYQLHRPPGFHYFQENDSQSHNISVVKYFSKISKG